MLLLLFMLFDASSELLFNMLVAAVVMSNILELIMNLLPNYPTVTGVIGTPNPYINRALPTSNKHKFRIITFHSSHFIMHFALHRTQISHNELME